MNTKQPHQYQHRILLLVIGMTPQIVTETLYKLAVQNQPPFVPTEVHLITTKEGAKSAQLALLGVPGNIGWFQQFKLDFNLPDIQFDSDNIHIISDTEGQFINDSESTEHNRVAADFITEKVKQFTANEHSALHVSLAGGRKTMSFYAGYALSLYGREQDRLSHVLVNLQFQNHKDFFYPRPTAERIEINNRYYSTDDANIILSDIPYVRMQRHIPRALLGGKEGYQETVEKIQAFSAEETVVLNIQAKTLQLNGVTVKLTASEFAFYLWLCERKIEGKGMLVFDQKSYMEDYIDVLSGVAGENSGVVATAEEAQEFAETTDKEGNNRYDHQKSYFAPHMSRTKRKIKDMLGEQFAQRFLIQTGEVNGCVAYGIGLNSESIHIE